MGSPSLTHEISAENVVRASLSLVELSRHYEQLLKHSTIVLWCAIASCCLSGVGLMAFVFLALTDPTGTSASLLTLLLKFGLPASFSGGLFWLYDRLQRRAMEVARLLARECRFDSARAELKSIADPQTRDAAHGRMAERLITASENHSSETRLGLAKQKPLTV